MVAHRVEQNFRKIRGEMIILKGRRRMGRKRPVRLRSPLAVLPNSDVAGRERSDAANGGPRRRNMPELEKRAQAGGVQLARNEARGKQGLEFGGEDKLSAGLVQVKRLDAQTVAPEHQLALAAIPDREGKHAAKFLDESFAIFLVEMKDDFRIRGGAKGMAAVLEAGAQFGGVIGFSVVGDPGLAILAGHGHAPAFAQVDDGEARVHQETRSEFLDSLAVRTAVLHGRGHAVRGRTQGFGWVHRRDSSNSAHEICQPSIGCPEPSKPVTLSFPDEHFYTYVNEVARASCARAKCARIWAKCDRSRNLALRCFCSGCSSLTCCITRSSGNWLYPGFRGWLTYGASRLGWVWRPRPRNFSDHRGIRKPRP